MAVMAREEWSDARLDELNRRVEEMRVEMREEFRGIRIEMQSESRALRAEFSAFTRTVTQVLWAIVGTIFLGFMGTIAALVTLV